jgi:hypothetical protein
VLIPSASSLQAVTARFQRNGLLIHCSLRNYFARPIGYVKRDMQRLRHTLSQLLGYTGVEKGPVACLRPLLKKMLQTTIADLKAHHIDTHLGACVDQILNLKKP